MARRKRCKFCNELVEANYMCNCDECGTNVCGDCIIEGHCPTCLEHSGIECVDCGGEIPRDEIIYCHKCRQPLHVSCANWEDSFTDDYPYCHECYGDNEEDAWGDDGEWNEMGY